MDRLSLIKCPVCGHLNNRVSLNCEQCGSPLGFPNVNIYSDQFYQDALTKRYAETFQKCEVLVGKNKIDEFETLVNEEGKAVINMKEELLFKIVNEDENYLPYQRAVLDGKRLIAKFNEDRQRTTVESSFYGSYGQNIIYAALSADGNGLISYGDVCVTLITKHIEKRTTVFERNSFLLIDDLEKISDWKPGGGEMPPGGYMGTWNNRSRVALNKHGKEIDKLKQKGDISVLIMNGASGDRSQDEFIELHIYNLVNSSNFAVIKFQRPNYRTNHDWKVDLEVLKEIAEKKGIEVVEQ